MVATCLSEGDELVVLRRLVGGLAAVVRQGRPKWLDREVHLPRRNLLMANGGVPPECVGFDVSASVRTLVAACSARHTMNEIEKKMARRQPSCRSPTSTGRLLCVTLTEEGGLICSSDHSDNNKAESRIASPPVPRTRFRALYRVWKKAGDAILTRDRLSGDSSATP